MASLATEEGTTIGRGALDRVETLRGTPFQGIEEGVNHFFVITSRGVEF